MAGTHSQIRSDKTRVGLAMPSVNAILESYAYEVAPDGVSFHSARMRLQGSVEAKAIQKMDEEHGWEAVKQLSDCSPNVIAYCCMASSIVGGLDYDQMLRDKVSDMLGIPATTVADSLITACKFLNIRRVCLASPYPEPIVDMERNYLNSSGIEVQRYRTLDIQLAKNVSIQKPEKIAELIRSAISPGIDAVLISSINFPTHLVVASLENELGVPIIAGTTALVWNILRICNRLPVEPLTLQSASLWRSSLATK